MRGPIYLLESAIVKGHEIDGGQAVDARVEGRIADQAARPAHSCLFAWISPNITIVCVLIASTMAAVASCTRGGML